MQKVSARLEFVPPMECKETNVVPAGEDWQYELKFDGYRTIATRSNSDVTIYSRNGKSFNARFPGLVEALRGLRAQSWILDGEIVALDEQGRHSFTLLQQSLRNHAPIHMYLFDLLHLDGKDLMKLPLKKRRTLLERNFSALPGVLQLSPLLEGDVKTLLEQVRQFEFEGLIAKRRDSLYEPGEEPGTWLKQKTQRSEDFLIGGYVPGRQYLDEIVVGEKRDGKFYFVESVKNGFVPASRRSVFDAIHGTEIDQNPFVNLPEKKGPNNMDREKMEEVRWVEPRVTAEVGFNERTVHGHLRHSKFLRLRETGDLRKRKRR
jgi:bifunctional non-homologous end joining protein LigD